jgi:hypothetical protein
MNTAESRITDQDLEHLPFELREMALAWRERMTAQERKKALAKLEDTARETHNLGILWAVEELRRSSH